MAPSRSQITTVIAGSALAFGVIFTVYLLKKNSKKSKGSSTSKKVEENTSQNAQSQDLDQSNAFEEEDLGSPLPDREGMTVSSSWAILNDNSETGSPHLSPVDSEDEMDDSQLVDTSQSTTVLEAGDSTLLSQKDSTMLSAMTERETATVEKITLEYEELLKDHQASGNQKFTAAEIQEALMATQAPEKGLSARNSEVLVGLMAYDDIRLKNAAVQGIANSAAFAANQNLLREKGCIEGLAKLLELQHMALWLRHKNASSSITLTLNAVINMAVNAENNKAMQPCLPTLLDISLDRDTGEAVCLSSLQALTNLSVTSDHHGHYTQLVMRLYEFLKEENFAIKLQALKILVNLSCNQDMVPHLLAAKAPEGLLKFLNTTVTDETLVLRFVTLLANILHVVKEKNITSSSLPPNDKAASPETMFTAIYGINGRGEIKNKVFLLCKHSNEDIRTQAARVYNQLK